MSDVVLVYEATCPHVPEARAQLEEAFARLGRPARWSEQRSDVPDAPRWARRHGSPTVLVDGRDVADAPSAGGCCRVYRDATGARRGAPSAAQIVEALTRQTRSGAEGTS